MVLVLRFGGAEEIAAPTLQGFMNAAALGALIIIAAIALALVGQALVDRLLRPDTLERAENVVGNLFSQAVSGVYGVLVAFLLAGALTSFQALRGNLTVELNALIELARLAQALPAPAAAEIGEATRAFAFSLVDDEWPHLAEGRANPRTTAALTRLRQLVATFSPSSAGEANLHAAALDLVRTIGEQRRILILAARRGLPALVWWILGIGGVVSIGISTLSAPPFRPLRFVLVAALTVLIALALYTLYALSHPFGPVLSIVDPQQLAEVRALLTSQP